MNKTSTIEDMQHYSIMQEQLNQLKNIIDKMFHLGVISSSSVYRAKSEDLVWQAAEILGLYKQK